MEFLVLLPPLFSSFTVSDDDNACEPQLCSFYDCTLYVNLLGYECGPGFSGVIGFQNSTSLPAYGFKGNSTSCTPFMSDSICFDMELPGLHTYESGILIFMNVLMCILAAGLGNLVFLV